MANRWKGNIIAAAATTSSGTDYTGKANGAWGLNSQLQQKQGGLWAKGVGVPSAPTIGTATSPSSSTAVVNFTNSIDNGGFTITSYTATSTPSGITASNTTSPITVTGLTDGTSYTFTVHANNAAGASPESAASNSVTPTLINSAILFGTNDLTGTSPFIQAYAWTTGSGYGAKYANPSALPGSQILTARFNSTGTKVIASASVASPFIFVYDWSSSGFGGKYANPASLPSITVGRSVCFDSNDTAAFIVGDTAPCVQAYSFSISGFGTKYANPSTTVGGTSAQSVGLNPAGNTIVIGSNGTPFVQAYSWDTSTGFGAKYTNPSILPTSSVVRDTLFNSAGTILFCAHNGTPFISAYNWSSGFGSKIADPSTLPPNTGYRLSYKNNFIALAHDDSPFISVYNFTSSFGSKVSDPSTIATGTSGRGVDFNYTNDAIAVSTVTSSPYQAVYSWSSGFGTKYADPSTALEGYGNSVRFSPY